MPEQPLAPIIPTIPKVACFLDFWNHELTMKELESDFKTDWFKLPQVLVAAAESKIGRPVTYEKMFIAGSYDPDSSNDGKLLNWARTVLSRVPGVMVDFAPRQKKLRGPCCTGKEHHEIKNCPECGASMLGTQEKGVDTRVATEMLHAGLTGQCEFLVLVSADKDFIPAVEKLQESNIKCIHAFFPRYGYELARKCWASFDLFALREQYRRPVREQI
jgi:uncharacterized LabA/DUF88 family protein